MSAEASKITSFRWPIVDFNSQWNDAYIEKVEFLYSESFALKTRPTAQFSLYFRPINGNFNDDFFGIKLKQYTDSKSIKINIKFWLEDENGKTFCEHFREKQVFGNVGDQCVFSPNDTIKIMEVYSARKTLFVCCELFNSSAKNPVESYAKKLVENYPKFLEAQWTLYEQEIYDAIIKVGNVEFKVMKSFFMAQSDVFKQMFLSKFKEGITSTIEVKDVSESAMKGLIKWFYTYHIEDESLIEELFAASDKYQIGMLKEVCIQNMVKTLNNDNILPRLAFANLHNNDGLKNAILVHIDSMSKEELADCLTSPELGKLYRKNVEIYAEILKLIREKVVKE